MFAALALPVEAGQLVEPHPEALAIRLQLELLRVVDDDPGLRNFSAVGLVGVLIEGNQHVELVT